MTKLTNDRKQLKEILIIERRIAMVNRRKIEGFRYFLTVWVVVTVVNLVPHTTSQASSVDMQLGFIRDVSDSRQSAVVVLGETRFAIITNDYNTVNIEIRDFDVATGFKGAKSTLIKNEEYFNPFTNTAAWIVSSMDQGIKHRCEPVVKRATVGRTNMLFSGRSNMFVSGLNGKIYLTKLVACPGKPLRSKTIIVGQGRRAALAIGKTDEGQSRLFVAWGDDSNGQMSGRFYSVDLDPIGNKVSITDASVGITIDMIWNPISKRFITGFRTSWGFSNCEYRNVSTFMNGTSLPAVTRFVGCDSDVGGHLSWVDIDKNTERNQSGNYAWWTSAESLPDIPEDTPSSERIKHHKKIHIMDKFGAFTGSDVLPSGQYNAVGDTQVFTEVINSTFSRSLIHSHEENLNGGRYMDHYIGDFHEQNGGLATFTNTVANRKKVKSLRVRSIGALKNHTVIVHGHIGSIRFLSVIKNQNPPLLLKLLILKVLQAII